MADVSRIPTWEMIDDYYASLMDLESCQKLLPTAEIALHGAEQDGQDNVIEHARRTVAHLKERIQGNQHIMNIIKMELEKRGESLPSARGTA